MVSLWNVNYLGNKNIPEPGHYYVRIYRGVLQAKRFGTMGGLTWYGEAEEDWYTPFGDELIYFVKMIAEKDKHTSTNVFAELCEEEERVVEN